MNKLYADVSKEEEYALIAKVQAKDIKATNALLDSTSSVGRYARFARAWVAQRYGKYPAEELHAFNNAALYGLYAAALAFKPEKDCRFLTLAYWYIKKHVNMERSAFGDKFAAQVDVVHLSTEMMDENYDLVDLINKDADEQEEARLESIAKVDTILDFVDLTDEEKYIIHILVLPNKGQKVPSQKALALEMGLSRSKVAELYKSAMNKLKDCGHKLYD